MAKLRAYADCFASQDPDLARGLVPDAAAFLELLLLASPADHAELVRVASRSDIVGAAAEYRSAMALAIARSNGMHVDLTVKDGGALNDAVSVARQRLLHVALLPDTTKSDPDLAGPSTEDPVEP